MHVENVSNSFIQTNDDEISIDGYNLINSNCPSAYSPLIKRDYIFTWDNCLVTEIRSQAEKCFLTLTCYPNQSYDDFGNIVCNMSYF